MNGKRMPPMAMKGLQLSLEMGERRYTRNTVELLLSHIEALEEELQEARDRRMIERTSQILESSILSVTEAAGALRQLIRSS